MNDQSLMNDSSIREHRFKFRFKACHSFGFYIGIGHEVSFAEAADGWV
jgi:hypothetical protein